MRFVGGRASQNGRWRKQVTQLISASSMPKSSHVGRLARDHVLALGVHFVTHLKAAKPLHLGDVPNLVHDHVRQKRRGIVARDVPWGLDVVRRAPDLLYLNGRAVKPARFGRYVSAGCPRRSGTKPAPSACMSRATITTTATGPTRSASFAFALGTSPRGSLRPMTRRRRRARAASGTSQRRGDERARQDCTRAHLHGRLPPGGSLAVSTISPRTAGDSGGRAAMRGDWWRRLRRVKRVRDSSPWTKRSATAPA